MPRIAVLLTATALALTTAVGCSAAEDVDDGSRDSADAPTAATTPTESGTPTAATTPTESGTPTAGATPSESFMPPTDTETAPVVPRRPHPVSLPAMMRREYDGGGLQVGDVLARTDAYAQHFVTYRSGGLRVSGILNVPHGRGPFPVLVLAHGYIDPDLYVNGQGMRREQDYLAREGYVVLHTDYRGHAASDAAPQAEQRLRLGYTEDVINAVQALRQSRLPFVDPERVGLVGRSMGGGVIYNVLVTQPGLVDAAVVFAPVSSNTVDNFNRWTRPQRTGVARSIIRAYGSPEDNPRFWRNVSPRTFFHRITEPVLIHHGTSDDSCPIRWSHRTLAAMERAGVRARMFVYEGEEHAFGPQWPLSMRRTVTFLDRHLT